MVTFLRTAALVVLLAVGSSSAVGAGHGPAFALATPTLGAGAWSSDTSVMNLTTDDGEAYMVREMLAYGITEDVTATVSVPLASGIDGLELDDPPRTRGQVMMGGFSEIEAGLWWRFQKRYPGAGQRYESTLYLNVSAPTDDLRDGIRVGPAVTGAAATGYASRTWYWWGAAGYQRYFERSGDRLGDLPYLSTAIGYRPPAFQQDYPKPDFRVFLEALAEFPRRDERDGWKVADSGGTVVLVGPSVLGLFGKYGVELGAMFPIHEDLHGEQPEERVRVTLDFTIWF